MRAKDLMSDGVTSVSAQAPILEAAKLLVNCHVSAMPVVDAKGKMLGIVSEADLIGPSLLSRAAENGTRNADRQAEGVDVSTRQVADVMTRDVIWALEDARLPDLARLMTDHRIKRIPIVRDGAVVGIVSRGDLLRALVAEQKNPKPDLAGQTADEQIRKEISAACQGRNWSIAKQLDVVVSGGVAHLWGVAPSEIVRKAYKAAAENIPGVRSVEVHMHVVRPAATRIGL